MKRLLAAITISAAVGLTGCATVVDTFGPKPQPELQVMAEQARADAERVSDNANFAELRDDQAEELDHEITRLCGTDDNGDPPPSCHPEEQAGATGATTAHESAGNTVNYVVDHAHAIPEDSKDLVRWQAAQLSGAAGLDVEVGAVPVEADATAARQMLEREYAFQYGLGLASAWADEPFQTSIDKMWDASHERTVALRAISEESDVELNAPPAISPGYEMSNTEAPQTAEQAAAFVDQLNSQIELDWAHTVFEAESPAWLRLAILLAGQAHSTNQQAQPTEDLA